MRCDYCYLSQTGYQFRGGGNCLQYSAEQIEKALSFKRLGGMCFINICAAGETLLFKEIVPIIYGLLRQGHLVNIVTNGTMTEQLEEIFKFPRNYRERCAFVFSYHYLELKRLKKIDEFFNNIEKTKKAGCSFQIKFVAHDSYIPFKDEIKKICIEKAGAPPQVSIPTDHNNQHHFWSSLTIEDFIETWKDYDSPMLKTEINNYMVKQNSFCYAGDWGVTLDLGTGYMWPCFESAENVQNIFNNPDAPIMFKPIGHDCPHIYCIIVMMTGVFGIMPDVNFPTYAEARDRPEAGWFNPTVKEICSFTFAEHP